MKTHNKLISFLTCSAMLVLTLAYIGCEDSPSPTDLDQYFADNPYADPTTSNPDQVAGTVKIEIIQGNSDITEIGQTISLKAVGGHEPYTWRVADTVRGTIDGTVQNQDSGAIYTALYTANQVAQNTIYADDASGMYGVLNIGPRSASTLAITPSSVTFSTSAVINATFQLFAVGGTPPYRWETDSEDILDIAVVAGVATSNKVNVSFDAPIAAGTEFSINVLVFDEGGKYATCPVKAE